MLGRTSGHYLKSVAAEPKENTESECNLDSTTTAAQLYHKILPYITPEINELIKPALWKRNITADTIYVDPDSSYQIKGILDWRYAEVVPVYRQVNQPPFLDKYGDAASSSAPNTIDDIYARVVSGRPMNYVVQALRFKKTTEY